MPRYMLDTDTSSYIMKRSNAQVLKKLQRVLIGDVCISAISRCELMYGVEVSPRRRQDQTALDLYLRHVAVLDYPSDAALDYAAIRADLKKRGAMIGGNDLLIAAHARCLGLTLVTNHVREFSRVQSLRVENWV
jgi:tRNA(fMet)-specific endonuclease VapC